MMEKLTEDLKEVGRVVTPKVTTGYGYGRRTTGGESSASSLVHPKTGEPIFTLSPGSYGKRYNLDWHPDFVAAHPQLEKSNEQKFGPKGGICNVKEHDSRSAAINYANAVINNFNPDKRDDISLRGIVKTDIKDPYSSTGGTRKMMSEYNLHDPETGEHIMHSKREVTADGDGLTAPVRTLNQDYLKTHGIDPTLAQNMLGKELDSYDDGFHKSYAAVRKIMAEKGKPKLAVGIASYGAELHHVYKVNGSPEEVSKRHEQELLDLHKTSGTVNEVQRLSPTAFVLHTRDPSAYGSSYIHHSHIIPGPNGETHLHHFKSKSKDYNGTATLVKSF